VFSCFYNFCLLTLSASGTSQPGRLFSSRPTSRCRHRRSFGQAENNVSMQSQETVCVLWILPKNRGDVINTRDGGNERGGEQDEQRPVKRSRICLCCSLDAYCFPWFPALGVVDSLSFPLLMVSALHVMCCVCAFVCVCMDAHLRVRGMHAENKRRGSIGQWLE
jgi:hypothetical protein